MAKYSRKAVTAELREKKFLAKFNQANEKIAVTIEAILEEIGTFGVLNNILIEKLTPQSEDDGNGLALSLKKTAPEIYFKSVSLLRDVHSSLQCVNDILSLDLATPPPLPGENEVSAQEESESNDQKSKRKRQEEAVTENTESDSTKTLHPRCLELELQHRKFEEGRLKHKRLKEPVLDQDELPVPSSSSSDNNEFNYDTFSSSSFANEELDNGYEDVHLYQNEFDIGELGQSEPEDASWGQYPF